MKKMMFLLLLLFTAVLSFRVAGAEKIWTGLGGDLNWSTADNWSETECPAVGDSLVFRLQKYKTVENDLDAAWSGLTVTNTSVSNFVLTVSGNPIKMVGSPATISLGTRVVLSLMGGLSGTNPVTISRFQATSASAPALWLQNPDQTFSGKIVLDGTLLQVTNRFSLIGDATPETVVPDALTLQNGGTVKNCAADLIVPAWQGITLGEGGGAFCSGWANNNGVSHTIFVESPITGAGALYIQQCACTTALNNAANDWQGGTYIGYNGVGSYSGECSVLRVGADTAIPAGTDITIDGSANGVLDVAGHTLTLKTVRLLNGGKIVNSSSAPATIYTDLYIDGGALDENVTMIAKQKVLRVSDTDIWTNRYYTVTSGETFIPEETTGVGGLAVKLTGGTLQFPARQGFSETRYLGNTVGNDVKALDRFQTSALMGSVGHDAAWGNSEGWFYETAWYVPKSGPYSFSGFFDDGVSLKIDGAVILSSLISGSAVTKTNVRLAKGWHTVQMWFSNGSGAVGPGVWTHGLKWLTGTAAPTTATGYGFDCNNGIFSFLPDTSSPVYVGPGGGRLEVLGDASLGEAEVPGIILRGGLIETDDNTAHDAVTLTGDVVIGNRGNTIPVFDAEVILAEGATLTFRDRVWLKRIPSCAYTVDEGTLVYLTEDTLSQSAALIEKGARIAVAPFNVNQEGGTIHVPDGASITLRSSSGWAGRCPTEDSDLLIFTNNIVLGAGSTLDISATGLMRLMGNISGSGTISVSAPVLNILSADNTAFTGTWLVKTYVNITSSTSLGAPSAEVLLTGAVSLEPDVVVPQRVTMTGNNNNLLVQDSGRGFLTSLNVLSGAKVNVTSGTIEVPADHVHSEDVIMLNGTGALAVNVPAGTVFSDGFTVAGAGILEVCGGGSLNNSVLSSSFNGVLRLMNSGMRSDYAPAAAPALWLDASAEKTLTRDPAEPEKVTEWRDVRDGADGVLWPHLWLDTSMRNWTVPGNKWALPPTTEQADGLNGQVLDFGAYNSGQWFAFSRDVNLRTVFFIIGSQNGGGCSFFSHTNAPKGYVRGGSIDVPVFAASNPIYSPSSWASEIFARSATRLNRVPVVPTEKGLSGGFDLISTVVDTDVPINGIGKDLRPLTGGNADEGKRSGGMKYAELLIYDRVLSDDEIARTEDYLAVKWFRETSLTPTAQRYTLDIRGTGIVDIVSAAYEHPFLSLTGDGTLVKTGAGKMTVTDSTGDFTGVFVLEQGGLSMDNPVLKGATETFPADRVPVPGFWADATVAESLGTDDLGRFYWRDRRWDGETDYIVATQRWAFAPTVLANEVSTNSVVSFGALSSSAHDRGLEWSRPLNAYAIFMLIGSQESGGTILGGSDNESPFNRYNFVSYTNFMYSSYTDPNVKNGMTRLDGCTVDGLITSFSGGYQTLSIIPTDGVTVGQFAHDRELTDTRRRDGGQRLGEVLVFTNKLTDAQRILVEGYLMTKWHRPGTKFCPQNLPAVAIIGDPAAEREIDTSIRRLSLESITGTNTLIKTGSEKLDVTDYSDYSGRIAVKEGSLALPPPSRPPADAAFWVDASIASSIERTNGLEVTAWYDWRENGRVARRAATATSTVKDTTYPNLNPTLLENELNGNAVVDFGAWAGNKFLLWNKPVTGIRTVFWVVGSQNGGGILLGYTGNTSIRDFYRAGVTNAADIGSTVSPPLDLNTITKDNFIWDDAFDSTPGAGYLLRGEGALTRVNGKVTDGRMTPLSGGYDLVTARSSGPLRASAFAMDRDRAYRNSTGGQRLAEVIVYERALTDQEIEDTERYLSRKWGLPFAEGVHIPGTYASDLFVTLMPGGTLSLYPQADYAFGGIGGAGTVTESSVSVARLEQIAPPSTNAVLAVAGDLTVRDGCVWTVDLSTGGVPAPIVVAGPLTFEGGGTIAVTGASGTESGIIPLVQVSNVIDFTPQVWTVLSDGAAQSFKLIRTNEGLALRSVPSGFHFFLR